MGPQKEYLRKVCLSYFEGIVEILSVFFSFLRIKIDLISATLCHFFYGSSESHFGNVINLIGP